MSIGTEIQKLDIGEFKPVAYYDQNLDCIRVYTHDRSIAEQRLDPFITIFRCNHKEEFDPFYVGFSLKGVRHMLDEIGLSMDRAYTLADLIDKMVKQKPGQINRSLLEVTLHSFQYNGELMIDFSDNEVATRAEELDF